MLTTSDHIQFQLEVSDSTVSIMPGLARLGNTLIPYNGGQIQFSQMTDFSGDSSKYQYSMLFLQNFNGAADATAVTSATASSVRELDYPTFPTDSTNPYSPVHELGLFTFYTPDATGINLISMSPSK